NAAGVLQGRIDFGLTALGQRQARLVADRLASEGAVRLTSSPLVRASQTAQVIAAAVGLEVAFDEGIAEYDIGEGSGLTAPQLREKFPDIMNARSNGQRFMFPGEEGREAFHARLHDALEAVRECEGTTVAVAHGGVISAMCHMVVGLDLHRPGAFQVANCSITEITEDRGKRLVLVRHNDVCHLHGLETTVDRG
ncbi:MAG: histidine phosphatase family protein, partial [bacterium]